MGMLDIHNHILWDVDDGAQSPSQTLELVRGLIEMGFDGAAPSPHSYADESECRTRLTALRELLEKEEIHFDLYENTENVAEPEEILSLTSGNGRTLAGGRVFLMELPHNALFPALLNVVALISRSGHLALIAHPERCLQFQSRPESAFEALDAGAFLQLDIMSIQGMYGRRAESLAMELLDADAYGVAATDIHSPRYLPALRESLLRLQSILPEDDVQRLLDVNPRRLISGLQPL